MSDNAIIIWVIAVFYAVYHGIRKTIQQYCQSPNIKIKEDMTGFSLSPLYLSDEELTDLVSGTSRTIDAVKKNEPKPQVADDWSHRISG